jgi:uncharacterized membrane protein
MEEIPRQSSQVIQTVSLPSAPDPELERKNLIFGLALFALFLVLFCAVIAAAFVYLAVD